MHQLINSSVSMSAVNTTHRVLRAALLTGARQEELLELQWDRDDLYAGTADLARQLQALGYRPLTTQRYQHADLTMMHTALAQLADHDK